jgi:hypothetical protein
MSNATKNIKKLPLPQGFSEVEIKELIEKAGKDIFDNPKIRVIEVKIEGKSFVGIFKKPSPKAITLAFPYIEKNLQKLCDILVKECWVDGDSVIKEEPQLVLAAGSKLVEYWLGGGEAEAINF